MSDQPEQAVHRAPQLDGGARDVWGIVVSDVWLVVSDVWLVVSVVVTVQDLGVPPPWRVTL
jgi:hypothetical protein